MYLPLASLPYRLSQTVREKSSGFTVANVSNVLHATTCDVPGVQVTMATVKDAAKHPASIVGMTLAVAIGAAVVKERGEAFATLPTRVTTNETRSSANTIELAQTAQAIEQLTETIIRQDEAAKAAAAARRKARAKRIEERDAEQTNLLRQMAERLAREPR